jgi:Uma2 family endonuclease
MLLDELADVTTDLPDRYEIIDGQIVEMMPMSADSSVFGSRLARFLSNQGIATNRGEAHTEILFKLPLERERNRRPDVAFVSYDQWPKRRAIPSTNAWAVTPDLCVEVVSPTDRAEEIREKITEYFQAGVRLVWVVYPRLQLVDVYDTPDRTRVLRRADQLEGGDVLPGFALSLTELFLEPDPPETPAN